MTGEPLHPLHPLHPIDRLAAALQEARLHKRRAHRCAALAVQAGDVPAVRRAMAHLRAAQLREARAYRRYVRAAFAVYCGPAADDAAPAGRPTAAPAAPAATGEGRGDGR